MIRIVVRGTPAPQGSKKFVGMAGGHGVLVESSKKVKPWRQDVKDAAQQVMGGRAPLDGPLVAVMTFTLPKPTSAPKTRRTWPDKKPDVSKLLRSTEDALTDAGVWVDDARGVEILVRKVFPNEHADSLTSPGVVIEIGHPSEITITSMRTGQEVAALPTKQVELLPKAVPVEEDDPFAMTPKVSALRGMAAGALGDRTSEEVVEASRL